jgi:hypothetical protein
MIITPIPQAVCLGRVTRSTFETAACLKSFGREAQRPTCSKFLQSSKIAAEEREYDLSASSISLSGISERILKMAPMFEGPGDALLSARQATAAYSVEARDMIVHALAHLSRDPATIRDRIGRLLRFD